jgi:hypothetical protein
MANRQHALAMVLECTDCAMKFQTEEEMYNHKEHFCINSDFVDPERALAKLEEEEERSDRGNAMTFDEVRSYLKGRDGDSSGTSGLGKMTLGDLRSNFESNDNEMRILREELQRAREREKIEEFRMLKTKQQLAHAQKNKEAAEIIELHKALELKKQVCRALFLVSVCPGLSNSAFYWSILTQEELKARLERERIKKQLHKVDIYFADQHGRNAYS